MQKNVELVETRQGDLLLMHDTGGYAMSMYRYNTLAKNKKDFKVHSSPSRDGSNCLPFFYEVKKGVSLLQQVQFCHTKPSLWSEEV